MTFKDQAKLIGISIVTLGIYPLIIFRKRQSSPSDTLSVATRSVVDVPLLLVYLGGADNVSGIEWTHTKVKFAINDRKLVQTEAIKTMRGIVSIFVTSGALTVVVGNAAKLLGEQMAPLID